MASLKLFLPALGAILELTVGALYERQRVLVSYGDAFENTVRGRGPGAGVPATPNNVAQLLITFLLFDRTSEIDQTIFVPRAAFSRSATTKHHLGEKRADFSSALGRILEDPALAKTVRSITLHRQTLSGKIDWRNGDISSFENVDFQKEFPQTKIIKSASIEGVTLFEISKALRSLVSSE